MLSFQTLHFAPGYFLLDSKKITIGVNAGVASWRLAGQLDSLDSQGRALQEHSVARGNGLTYGFTIGRTENGKTHRWYALSYQKFSTSFGSARLVMFSIGSGVNLFSH